MRSGLNPTRRNRNIGTPKQGHGQDNALCVATPRAVSGPFWERLESYRMVTRTCGGRDLPIFVEETRRDCVHACSVGDIVAIFDRLPAQNCASLAAVVLRQPKRKEQILHQAWGRMVYYAYLGRPQEGAASGRAIILEAVTPDRVWYHPKSVGPTDAAELDRLMRDGHRLTTRRSRIEVESSLDAIRATQLYRTLPHEIGHIVDHETKTAGLDLEDREKYWQRPPQELEVFAHRYADDFRARMFESGRCPFPRIESWVADGLRPEDFAWPKPARTS